MHPNHVANPGGEHNRRGNQAETEQYARRPSDPYFIPFHETSNPAEMIENKDLTSMQKHVLKFILLETIHRDLYQKDIEEEFQIRKPTVTGILQLMEKNGYIYRECAKQDARLKRILPTEKAESLRQPILHSIEEDEAAMIRGIPKEDVELCKQVLWQMCANRKKMCNKKDSNYKK